MYTRNPSIPRRTAIVLNEAIYNCPPLRRSSSPSSSPHSLDCPPLYFICNTSYFANMDMTSTYSTPFDASMAMPTELASFLQSAETRCDPTDHDLTPWDQWESLFSAGMSPCREDVTTILNACGFESSAGITEDGPPQKRLRRVCQCLQLTTAS